MRASSLATHNRLLAAALALAGLSACEPLVDVNLKVIEPCNQRDKALAGVETYQVSHDGPGETNAVLLTKAGQSEPLLMRALAEDVTVTVQGFVGDVNQDASVTNGDPQAIGRSLPLDIEGKAQDMELVVPMGLVDSFGQSTDATGACTFSQNGAPIAGRHAHTATYLPTENKVLIVGGAVWVEENGTRGESFLRTAELFDPATGTFEALPDMPNARGYHTATLLPDGRVLIAGGFGVIGGAIDALTNAIVYTPNDPSGDPWLTRLILPDQRAMHTATLLPDQQLVLLIGGCAGEGCRPRAVQNVGGDPTAPPFVNNAIVVYDIANDEVIAQPGVMSTPRAMHAASALGGGRVLVSGGATPNGPVCNIEIFETTGSTVRALTPDDLAMELPTCPVGHAQVTLSDSRVMMIGGQTTAQGGVPAGPGTNVVQFWSTTVGVESPQAQMLTARHGHAATLLDDGSVLVMGGVIPAGGATAERLVPQGETFMSKALLEPMLEARAQLGMARLPNNQVVVVGGSLDGQTSSDMVEIYFGR